MVCVVLRLPYVLVLNGLGVRGKLTVRDSETPEYETPGYERLGYELLSKSRDKSYGINQYSETIQYLHIAYW